MFSNYKGCSSAAVKREVTRSHITNMRTLGNVIWFFFLGGFWSWLLWLIAALLAFASIIGIPFGRACYNISELAVAPFGKEAINRRELTLKRDIGTSAFGTVGNLVWFLALGFWIALAHTLAGVACCLTLLGIPFGLQHFKLAGLAIAPVGKSIVTTKLAEEARQANAKADLAKVRGESAVSDLKIYDDI
ncbi:YccF domain-containing protein [Burkholderia gladioli]|uniref:YccF domain-containing protein n=1 Tax=Burkholderia gladioli TaxID=28095 RepID=UPI001FC81C12|nr:YccF domain-containing protein [Burkholderia gladioli]